MAFNSVKFLRGENKRLQSLVTKLTGTNEAFSLQLKQKENALAKRRNEVAILHQACAKYKSRARTAPLQRLTTPSTIELAVCLRCEKAKDVFDQLKVTVEAFAEKLNTALKEKDAEIEKLAAALAERDRRDEERRQRIEKQKADERERACQSIDDTMRRMAEMQAQQQIQLDEQQRKLEEQKRKHQLKTEQRLREIEERKLENQRLLETGPKRNRRVQATRKSLARRAPTAARARNATAFPANRPKILGASALDRAATDCAETPKNRRSGCSLI